MSNRRRSVIVDQITSSSRTFTSQQRYGTEQEIANALQSLDSFLRYRPALRMGIVVRVYLNNQLFADTIWWQDENGQEIVLRFSGLMIIDQMVTTVFSGVFDIRRHFFGTRTPSSQPEDRYAGKIPNEVWANITLHVCLFYVFMLWCWLCLDLYFLYEEHPATEHDIRAPNKNGKIW